MLDHGSIFNACLLNAKDIKGKKQYINIILPSDNIHIPKNIVELEVYEYNKEDKIIGNKLYRILIGKKCSLNEFFHFDKGYNPRNTPDFDFRTNMEKITDLNCSICYIVDNSGKCIIYAVIHDNDIIVKDYNQMEDVIRDMSEEIESINNVKRLKRVS